MRTETIKYTITDEEGNVTEHTCTVYYRRNTNARTNSERDSVAERTEPFHSGMERD